MALAVPFGAAKLEVVVRSEASVAFKLLAPLSVWQLDLLAERPAAAARHALLPARMPCTPSSAVLPDRQRANEDARLRKRWRLLPTTCCSTNEKIRWPLGRRSRPEQWKMLNISQLLMCQRIVGVWRVGLLYLSSP
jgi:hypothetical protein